MQTVREILEDLATDIRWDYARLSVVKAAITRAEEQIEGRMEKAKKVIERVEMFLDGINFSDPPPPPYLCRYCKTTEYDGVKGIIHDPDCLILELRAALAELEK